MGKISATRHVGRSARRRAIRILLGWEVLESRRLLSIALNDTSVDELLADSGSTRSIIPGEIEVAMRSSDASTELDSILAEANFSTFGSVIDTKSARELLRLQQEDDFLTLVQFGLNGMVIDSAIELLSRNDHID